MKEIYFELKLLSTEVHVHFCKEHFKMVKLINLRLNPRVDLVLTKNLVVQSKQICRHCKEYEKKPFNQQLIK